MTRVLAASVAMVVAAACGGSTDARSSSASTTSTTVAATPRVLVIGDSNIGRASLEIDAALRAAGTEPTVDAVAGTGLKDLDSFWLPRVRELLAEDPDVVVVGLGTNDAPDPATTAAFPARFDRLMDALGQRPVVWVTHLEQRPEPVGTGARAREIHTVIRAAPDRYPGLTVLDLTPLLEARPEVIDPDGLHYSAGVGYDFLAQQIAAAAAGRLDVRVGSGKDST